MNALCVLCQEPTYGPYVAESDDDCGASGDESSSSSSDDADDGCMNEELGRALDELGYEERPTTRWQ